MTALLEKYGPLDAPAPLKVRNLYHFYNSVPSRTTPKLKKNPSFYDLRNENMITGEEKGECRVLTTLCWKQTTSPETNLFFLQATSSLHTIAKCLLVLASIVKLNKVRQSNSLTKNSDIIEGLMDDHNAHKDRRYAVIFLLVLSEVWNVISAIMNKVVN